MDRVKPGKFEEFYKLILHIHRIANMEVMIGYADVHGDLLPINNDDNFCKAVSTAHPLLRIFIQRQGGLSEDVFVRSLLLTIQKETSSNERRFCPTNLLRSLKLFIALAASGALFLC